jgi:hypothetical protein
MRNTGGQISEVTDVTKNQWPFLLGKIIGCEQNSKQELFYSEF